METFTVELLSSGSTTLYTQSTLATLAIFLLEEINLEGEREVALTEICFPSKFFTITEASFGISVSNGEKVIDSEKHKLSPG